MSKLFIIGNGFDLAHSIPTSYNDFRAFLISKYPDSLKNRDRILNISEIKNYEENLSVIQ